MKRARESEEVLALDIEVAQFDNYVYIYQELSRVLGLCVISDVRSVIVGYLADVVFLNSQENPTITIPIFRPFLIAHAQVFRELHAASDDLIFSLDYSTDVLQLLVMYVESHKLQIPPLPRKPLVSNKMADNTNCKFDAWFVDVCDSKTHQLADLTHLANFWNLSGLLQLLCAKYASKMRSVPLDQFKKCFDALSECCSATVPSCECGFH